MAQNVGISVPGKPWAGHRHAIGRDLASVDWVRVFDLLPRLAHEFRRVGLFEDYRANLNRILAGNGIAWDMDESGNLIRALPEEAAVAVKVAMRELSRPEFDAAQRHLLDAIDAYNDRPQRPRDACANAFAAAESAGKVVFGLPSGTFDDVVRQMRKRRSLQPEIVRALDALNIVRHNHFGHGTAKRFALSGPEVDFVYLSSVAAVIAFARI
jgi:hypothetical protein